jgi:hypothetical protein
MKRCAFATAAVVLCLASGQAALADCLGDDPTSAAKAFYQDHADFYYADPARLQGLIAPRLLKLLTMNFACSDGQECALDSDPWVDAQDGDVDQPITYQLTDQTDVQATVVMHYIFALSESEHSPQQVTLKLRRQDQCWQVEDMVTPRGKSLADEIDTWFKSNGSDATPQ